MELAFPALTGGFFTAEPLGKTPKISLKCSPNFQLLFISGGMLSYEKHIPRRYNFLPS